MKPKNNQNTNKALESLAFSPRFIGFWLSAAIAVFNLLHMPAVLFFLTAYSFLFLKLVAAVAHSVFDIKYSQTVPIYQAWKTAMTHYKLFYKRLLEITHTNLME